MLRPLRGFRAASEPADRPEPGPGGPPSVIRLLRPRPDAVPLLDRPGWRTLRVDATGLVVGTLMALQAMTPSLLPRSWIFQAMVSGVSGAIGYGIGVLLSALAGRTKGYRWIEARVRRTVPASVRRGAWLALVAAVPMSLLIVLVVASDWQRETRVRIGMPAETSSGWLRGLPVILGIAALLVCFFRFLRLVSRWATRLLGRWIRLPRRLAQVVGLVVALAVGLGLFDGVVLRGALGVVDSVYSVSDQKTPAGVHRPQLAERSGSPASLSPWNTLGRKGRIFVAGGPSRAEMATAAGIPESAVVEPVRVYVGLRGAATVEKRAALAVAELDRTGAFDRAVLCVITTTGTGLVDSASPQALELMYGGNTAMVAMQYSYLPSWISFLVDRSVANEAGRVLFDAVYARVQQLPVGHRPRLLVYGESLGAAGSEAAFSGLTDLRARTDGVLWVGPPHSDELWRQLVERRDPGTPEVAPVYAGGLVVRFGNRPADLAKPAGPWLEPRIAFLMHSTDPVVWWTPSLLFTRPDWLEEPRGQGVSPTMDWRPVVTFWQVSADLANALYVPQGYGHNYGAEVLDAWAMVAPPPGWTAGDTDRARAVAGPNPGVGPR